MRLSGSEHQRRRQAASESAIGNLDSVVGLCALGAGIRFHVGDIPASCSGETSGCSWNCRVQSDLARAATSRSCCLSTPALGHVEDMTKQPQNQPEPNTEADEPSDMESADVANGESPPDFDNSPVNETEAMYGENESPA
jgi:hypothetical protein